MLSGSFLLISRRKQTSIDKAMGVFKGLVFFVLAPESELLMEGEGYCESLFLVVLESQ